jgi:predicted acyl esterase
VHLDGQSVNVCDGLFRVAPGPGEAQPDGSLRVEIDMWAAAHRFRAGHRLRLQLSSSAHPRWSRNLGTGEATATGVGMAVAEQTVYYTTRRIRRRWYCRFSPNRQSDKEGLFYGRTSAEVDEQPGEGEKLFAHLDQRGG